MNEDKFLTQITGWRCGYADLRSSDSLVGLEEFEFAHIKTDLSTDSSLMASRNNFYLADVSIQLSMDHADMDNSMEPCPNIEIATAGMRDQVALLAGTSFLNDRFRRDPNIPNKIAAKIKSEWASNYFEGRRGDACFVFMGLQNFVQGFLLTVIKDDVITIDLIAVDRHCRRKGIARNLIMAMLKHYGTTGINFAAGTQLINSASLPLYHQLGFKVTTYSGVWHFFNRRSLVG